MSPSSTRIVAALALVITFIVGGIVGVVVDRTMIMRGGGTHHPSAQFITRRLDKRLHFTDQQRTQVTEIIDRHQKRIAAVWANVWPSVHAEVEAANIEIDRVLTPEQRVTFAKIRTHVMPRRTGDGIRVRHD